MQNVSAFQLFDFAGLAPCQFFKNSWGHARHPKTEGRGNRDAERCRQMSWQAVTWVLEFSESTSYSRLVLIAIASHANREGKNAFPSLDTIALEARVSRREVVYCVQELEEKGELAVIRGIGRGNPNHYELRHVAQWLEKVHDMHQLEKGKGAQETVKGANRRTKGANTTQKQVSSLLESSKSKTERLEPSKALTVKAVANSFSIPEPSKSTAQLRAEADRQLAALREKGYIQ
jgi:Helix-turn-helix domain